MKRQRLDPYVGPATVGLDVSAYQPDVDWPRVARSEAHAWGRKVGPVEWAAVRTSDGVQTRRNSKPDPWAVRHLTGAHGAGLRCAAYHYVRGHHGAGAQVALVLDVLATASVPVEWVALDLEGRPDDPRTPDTDESRGAWWHPPGSDPVDTPRVLTELATMVRLLEDAGHRVLIYSGVSWHWYVSQKRLPVPPEVAACGLWTPYYTRSSTPRMPCGPAPWTPYYTRSATPRMPCGPAPWEAWEIWQLAGSAASRGRVAGVSGLCDVNRWRIPRPTPTGSQPTSTRGACR